MRGRILTKEAILVLILQAVLCVIAFNKFFSLPGQVIFQDLFDGIKNYFTFQTYLQQDASAGMALVQGHAYPYGDYLFYADLTPSVAVPLRFFSLYIYDISEHGILLYNYIIIAFQWLAALVAFHLFSHFVKTRWLAVVLCITFTWIHPQFFRLGNGHFNLSIALFLLLTLLLLVQIYKDHQKDPARYFATHKGKVATVVLVLYWASFSHLYYLPILGVTIGFFALFHSIDLKWRQGHSWGISVQPALWLGGACVLGLVLVFGTIRLVDSYYELRAVGNLAYGYDVWKLDLSSLYSARPTNYLGYLFSSREPAHYESNLYLGAFTLYSLTLLLALKLFGRAQYISAGKMLSEVPVLKVLLAVAFVGFAISMGDDYYFGDNEYYYNNYLNPFFYLRQYVSRIEQFRCLARFFWPSFWIIALTSAYFVDYYYRKHPQLGLRVLAGALALLCVSDAKDVIKDYNGLYHRNYFDLEWSESLQPEMEAIDFSEYQALLPIPYFHTNAEENGLIIDGDVYYIRETQFISLRSGLPMMSVQSSRLPVEHTRSLFSIFTNAQPDSSLLANLNDKPILVLYRKSFYENAEILQQYGIPNDSPAKDVVLNGKHLPNYYNMEKIGENHYYIFYKWYPKINQNFDQTTYSWDMEMPMATAIAPPVDSSRPNQLIVTATNSAFDESRAHSGKQSLRLAPQSIVLQQELLNVQAGSIVEVKIWRHREAALGALIAKGTNYYQQSEIIVKEEGDWQQIKASFFVPGDYSDQSLQISYWNATNETVYLDDYSIVIRTRK
jgi:hypothetical protein